MVKSPEVARTDRVSFAEKAASVALGVEAAGLLGWAGATVGFGVTGEVERADTAAFIAGFAILIAVGLVLTACAMWSGVRWALGAAIAWQILQAGVGIPLLASQPAIALAILAPVAVVAWGVILAARRVARSR